jgi:hypothetical protein
MKPDREGEFYKVLKYFSDNSVYKDNGKLNASFVKQMSTLFKKSYEDYLNQAAAEEVMKRTNKAINHLKEKEGLPTRPIQSLQEIKNEKKLRNFLKTYIEGF